MKQIILHAQCHIGQDRSIFGLFHILQGRSSIQTIQDVKLYHLHAIYGVYRKLERKRFVAIIEALVKESYLRETELDYYKVTTEGKTWLNKVRPETSHFYLDGEKYGKQDRAFFHRLQLLIQVWTNMKKGNNQFVPMIEDRSTANWVKQFYRKTKHKMDTYLIHLYEELLDLFLPLPENYPAIFLAQLSSYHHIGQTIDQLAVAYQCRKEDIYLITANVLHYLFQQAEEQPSIYPVLFALMNHLQPETNVTHSAKVTAQYLHKGHALDTIADRRELKVNTIYDHIVELAVHNHPVIRMDDYVTVEEIEDIRQAILQSGSYKLKAIKEKVAPHISYFQIRLVLAVII